MEIIDYVKKKDIMKLNELFQSLIQKWIRRYYGAKLTMKICSRKQYSPL